VITAPILVQRKQTVGAAVVSFSLQRENAAIAEVERSTLWASAGMGLVLAALLIGVTRLTVVQPLGKLVAAAAHLEKGESTEVDIRSNDELGQLSSAFRSMAHAIRSREEVVLARNRDMRQVLDNVGQGFITLDRQGRMSQQRSRVVDVWFGELTAGLQLWEYLGKTAPHFALQFQMGWEQLQDDVLPLELCIDQLPRILEQPTRTLEFSYRAIRIGEALETMIVVISDVTERLEREQAEQTQREMMTLFNRMLSDRVALDEFFAEGSALVSAIESDDETLRSALRRNIHTLKGSSALFGLESIASFCHELEDRVEESSRIDQTDRSLLRALWTRFEGMRAALARDGSIDLDRNDYDTFLQDLARRVDHSVLLSVFSSWRYEPAARRFELLKEQILRLAERLDKKYVDVVCLPTQLRLPQSRWARFWSVFAHVVRNAVDHGVDTVEERAAAGKSPRATITLGLELSQTEVTLSIRDDGRGIDWPRLAARAQALGLPHASQQDLEEALYAEGVSTAARASTVSGRGVGMGAARAVTQELGGKIEIVSTPGQGTRFAFVFPVSMLTDDPIPRSTLRPNGHVAGPAVRSDSNTSNTPSAVVRQSLRGLK
jgi:two-component system chemotaxis sensor kinase CheA